jgi:hypothetical protein
MIAASAKITMIIRMFFFMPSSFHLSPDENKGNDFLMEKHECSCLLSLGKAEVLRFGEFLAYL